LTISIFISKKVWSCFTGRTKGVKKEKKSAGRHKKVLMILVA